MQLPTRIGRLRVAGVRLSGRGEAPDAFDPLYIRRGQGGEGGWRHLVEKARRLSEEVGGLRGFDRLGHLMLSTVHAAD